MVALCESCFFLCPCKPAPVRTPFYLPTSPQINKQLEYAIGKTKLVEDAKTVRTRTHARTHTHTHVRAHTHTHTHAHTHAHAHAHMHTHTPHTHTHTHTHARTHTPHTHTHTHTHTHAHTHEHRAWVAWPLTYPARMQPGCCPIKICRMRWQAPAWCWTSPNPSP